MNKTTLDYIPEWIHQLYLYVVSAIMLVIFTMGTITILNLTIREFVFGVQGSWYRNAEEQCRNTAYERDIENMQPYNSIEECVTAKKIQIAEELKHERARDISNALGMLIVSFPIYWYHWRIIKQRNNVHAA